MTTPEHDGRSESEPLLLGDENRSHNSNGPIPPSPPRWVKKAQSGMLGQFQVKRRGTILTLLTLLMFLLTTSGMMILLPIFRLLEDSLCHTHYHADPSEPIDEKLCKVEAVQKKLALLGGIGAVFNAVLGMVAALPYGVLADRIGRKPTFTLSYIGIILAFAWPTLLLATAQPVNLVLAMVGSLFFLIGGGIPIAMNTLHAMAADVSSSPGGGDQSTGFLYLSFGAVSGSLVGPFTSGILMEVSGPWLAISIVYAITPLVFTILLFIPETLPLPSNNPSDPMEEEPQKKSSIRQAISELKTSLALLRNKSICCALATFAITGALFAAYSSILAQHISVYLGWTLAQVSYRLTPPLALLHLLVILALPRVSALVTARLRGNSNPVYARDLLIAKVSLALMVVAAIVEGLSRSAAMFIAGLVVGTLGAASGPMCRAVATAHVRASETSRLYSLVSVVETAGSLIGGPVLAWLFGIGLANGGLWIGLPWFYVAGLVSVALGALTFVGEPDADIEVLVREGEGSA